jgi:hypothetical protein
MTGIQKYLNKSTIRDVIIEIFAISLAVYAVLFLLEWISPGFVSFYFNADIVLWVLIVSSLGYFFTPSK